jgi:hypothetical protein
MVRRAISVKLLVIVTGSTARKIPPRGGLVEAQFAYARSQFERRCAYARRFGDAWLIFSAKWGLLSPTTRIDPTYPPPAGIVVDSATLKRQLIENDVQKYDVVQVLAGKAYVALLREPLRELGVPLSAPLLDQGLGMGRQSAEIHHRTVIGEPFPT